MKSALLALLLAVAPAPLTAAPPGAVRYALDCVPGDDAAGALSDWLRARLALRGFDEDARAPTLRLCFRVRATERLAADDVHLGVGFGHRWQHGFGGAFWDLPVYRVVAGREAGLVATRAGETAPYWEDRAPLARGDRAALEAALRALIDRLPAP
ncbi:hypothetical protein [Crenobacter luteus]|uniref:DUF4136 domain-containing protein n=1 Tax=Crenobacter luteus TaxID=1452487 RepID=A0A165FSD2_9NEIS|nr:hypothetical protein [Crenobacter luteus]KZE34062.1 hypothetical protein AVW16_07075 [Crenobacter luteus]